MYLRYYLNEKSQRVYTFNVSASHPILKAYSSTIPPTTQLPVPTPLVSPLMTHSLNRE